MIAQHGTDFVTADLVVELRDGTKETYPYEGTHDDMMLAVHELAQEFKGSMIRIFPPNWTAPYAVHAA